MIPEKPQTILTPFCYAGDTRNIPATTPAGTNQFSYEAGFPPLTSTPLQSGGVPPERQDFNAAFKLLSEFIYYLQSGNQFVWSNLLDYDKGCTILGSDGALYLCIQTNGATSPNTVQDPTTSTGYWVKVIDSQGILNINIIGDGTITNAKIADTTITGTKLANDTITSAQIAANAVTASELANNAVDTAAIAAGAVTDAKITSVAASKVSGLSNVAAPLPVDNSGTTLGAWQMLISLTTPSAILPSGGSWAWFLIGVTSNNALLSLSQAGVDSGGTSVGFLTPVVGCVGFCWRIQ